MFIFGEDMKLTFVSRNFIKTHSLPSMEALQGTSIITMLAFIVSPETDSDHNVLLETEAKLRALRTSEEVIYNLLIGSQLYELSSRLLSNGEIIGKMSQLDCPQVHSKENEKVGDVLTTLLLADKPLPDNSNNIALRSKSNLLPIKSLPSINTDRQNQDLPRILVVDDSEVNREVVDIFLSPDFPEPLYAKNGQEALAILQNEQVDLVLMDIHMPEMNGVEATLAIREADAPWSNVIIIALTADTEYQHSRVYQNVGMNDAISKPIRQDILMRTILMNWNAAKLSKEAQSMRLDYAS